MMGRGRDEGHRPTGGEGEAFRILFVCTGNTCRSPLAEVIARRELAERGWSHVQVGSAGVASLPGGAASEGSLRTAARHGLSLDRHRSAPLTPERIDWADLVLTMSGAHLAAVFRLADSQGKAALLTDFAAGREGEGRAGEAVADPVGGSDEVYEATFLQLEALVRRALDRLAPLLAP